MVSADWLTSASGVAGCSLPSSATEPVPPVMVTVPGESLPSAPMGRATTALAFSSLVMR
jgi:hypothetical protein